MTILIVLTHWLAILAGFLLGCWWNSPSRR